MSSGFLSLNPSGTVNLGDLAVGQTAGFNIAMTNSGTEPTVITSIVASDPQISLTFVDALNNPLTLPITVYPGLPADFIGVLVTDTATAAVAATITATCDAINNPVVIPINWVGHAAITALIAFPSGYLFANTKIGNQSAEALFAVKNTGTVNVTVNSYTFPTDFIAGPTGPVLPQTLTPGQTYLFGIIFAPTAQGLLSENVQIASTAPASPFLLNVQGVGYAINPAFIVPPTTPLLMGIGFLGELFNVLQPGLKVTTLPFNWISEEDAFVDAYHLLPFPTEQGMIEGYSYEKRINRVLFHYEDWGTAIVFVTVTTMRGQTTTQEVRIGTFAAPGTPAIAFTDFELTDEIINVMFEVEGFEGFGNGPLAISDYVIRYLPKGERKGI